MFHWITQKQLNNYNTMPVSQPKPIRQPKPLARFEEEEFEEEDHDTSSGEDMSEEPTTSDEDFIVDDDEEIEQESSSEEEEVVEAPAKPQYQPWGKIENRENLTKTQVIPKGYAVIKKVTEYYGVPKKTKGKAQKISTPEPKPEPTPTAETK